MAICLLGGIDASEDPEMGGAGDLQVVMPCDPYGEFVLVLPTTLGLVGLKVLTSWGSLFLLET